MSVIRRLADGLYVIETDGDKALWSRRKLRKDTRCAATRLTLLKGQTHYGPIGNMFYRWQRLHREFVEAQG